MILKMYIGKVFVDSIPVEYEGLFTASHRQEYQEKLARELIMKHIRKIKSSRQKPVFFVEGVPSMMNCQAYP